nr:SDR family NAD(P)-dependent oxidoreductase [Actinomycetota bacterium]
MQLSGKLAVITGGATGIGRSTALLFAQEGATVAIGDINEEGGRQTAADIEAAGGSASFMRCDVTEVADVEGLMRAAAETMGGIDVIVNNAGAQRSGRVTEFLEEEWDLLM